MLLHGSTVATNAVLEHKFAGLGLLVTRGFRHLIEIARQSVPDGYGNSFFWVKPQRLVPLHLVREVPGRLRFDGSELEPLDEAATSSRACSELVEDGVRCIAVCLLHSYANDAHEQRVGELIAKHFPDVFVSLSSVVLPEYREYERAMTTLIDVLVKPYCRTYLQRAADKIRSTLRRHPVPDHAVERRRREALDRRRAAGDDAPVRARPPACSARCTWPQLAGYRDILTIDVGGTSTDVSIIENHQAALHLDLDGRELSGEDADARHRHRRLRRRLDRLDRLRTASSRSARRAPAPIPARSATARAAPSRPSPTPAIVARPPAGGAGRRRDRARPRPPRAAPIVALGEQLGLDAGGACRRRARNRRRQPGVRHPPGDHVARPRAGRLCHGRLRRRGRAVRHRSRRLPRHQHGDLAARSGQPLRLRPARLRCHAATISARWCAGKSRPTRTRSLAAWGELARLGLADIEAEGIPEDAIAIQSRRRRPLFRRRPRGPGRHSRRTSPGRAIAGFHVEGIPQGA